LPSNRRPPKTGDTFSVIQQANIAGQQVIQNHGDSNENATNKQGCSPGAERGGAAAQPPAALPADTGRDGFAAIFSPAGEAVGEVNRAEDAGGQGPIK